MIGYNMLALPIAAGMFEPAFALILGPIPPPSRCQDTASSSRSTHALNRVQLPHLHLDVGSGGRAGRRRPVTMTYGAEATVQTEPAATPIATLTVAAATASLVDHGRTVMASVSGCGPEAGSADPGRPYAGAIQRR